VSGQKRKRKTAEELMAQLEATPDFVKPHPISLRNEPSKSASAGV